jgi:outer membrane protein OmpA-like peptidoglycan-associated protein
MNHEYEQHRANTPSASMTHNYMVEPGQSSRSALLRKPERAILSGLVQRTARSESAPAMPALNEPQQAAGSAGTLSAPTTTRDESSSSDIHALAMEGISGSATTLPFLDQIQRAFGAYDVSDTQAHIGGSSSGACQRMGATAYATGNHVAFAEAPDLHTVAHEAAHVVQQRAGVQLAGGIGQAGDEYEKNADQVAEAVVAGRSAEALLELHAGSVASVATKKATTGTMMGLVQRKCAACGTAMNGSGNCPSCNEKNRNGVLAKLEQQRAPSFVQGLGRPTSAPPALPCTIATSSPSGFVSQVNFQHDSAAITPGMRATLEAFVASWHAQPGAPQIRLDGYASTEGAQAHNLTLSCSRAMAVKAILIAPTSTGSPGIPVGAIDVYTHGATTEFSGGLPGNRLVTISVATPLPSPTPEPTPAVTPVYICAKPLATSPAGNHAFFRFGGAGPGNPTMELEPEEVRPGCYQGIPQRNFYDDYSSPTTNCLLIPVSQATLDTAFSAYPIGQYCTLGPNSNTFIGELARGAGVTVRPSGWLPGFDDSPPSAGTFSPSPLTTLLFGCSTSDCSTPDVPDAQQQQMECVKDQGGCGIPGGIPTDDDMHRWNTECRQRSGYEGPDIIPTPDDCTGHGPSDE